MDVRWTWACALHSNFYELQEFINNSFDDKTEVKVETFHFSTEIVAISSRKKHLFLFIVYSYVYYDSSKINFGMQKLTEEGL